MKRAEKSFTESLALDRIPPRRPDCKLDVIFVHGLGDNDVDAWQHKGVSDSFWPKWLAADFDHIQVWTLRYGAPKFWFEGATMALPDRAKSVLSYLVDEGIGQRPLIFIAHSLGGLVVKELLRTSDAIARERLHLIATATRGVVFLATPHTGADIANIASKLGAASDVTRNLKSNDPWLSELKDWYRDNAAPLNYETRSYYETERMGPATVVDRASADPNVAGERAIGVDKANHVNICKPRTRRAAVYKSVAALIRACLAQAPSTEPLTEPNSVDSVRLLVRAPGDAKTINAGTFVRLTPDNRDDDSVEGFLGTPTPIAGRDELLPDRLYELELKGFAARDNVLLAVGPEFTVPLLVAKAESHHPTLALTSVPESLIDLVRTDAEPEQLTSTSASFVQRCWDHRLAPEASVTIGPRENDAVTIAVDIKGVSLGHVFAFWTERGLMSRWWGEEVLANVTVDGRFLVAQYGVGYVTGFFDEIVRPTYLRLSILDKRARRQLQRELRERPGRDAFWHVPIHDQTRYLAEVRFEARADDVVRLTVSQQVSFLGIAREDNLITDEYYWQARLRRLLFVAGEHE